jgi:hypothetical protein
MNERMRERVERINQHWDVEFRKELREILMAFADSIAKLQADVNALIAQNGNEAAAIAAAVASAVAAKDAQDAAAVDAVDASVAAALVPAAPAAPAAKS